MGFYCHYMATWPEYFVTAESRDGSIQGYVMGKAEGKPCCIFLSNLRLNNLLKFQHLHNTTRSG